jgi:hypothetical protein
MANSIQKLKGAPVTPLGFVKVTTPGTPVAFSANIDANNTNSPSTPYPPPDNFPGAGTEYAGSFRGFAIQTYQPNGNNQSIPYIPNVGNVYLMVAAAGGSGNRFDSGSLVKIIPPGADFFFPSPGTGRDMFSPYTLFLDADNGNDGAIVVAYGGG